MAVLKQTELEALRSAPRRRIGPAMFLILLMNGAFSMAFPPASDVWAVLSRLIWVLSRVIGKKAWATAQRVPKSKRCFCAEKIQACVRQATQWLSQSSCNSIKKSTSTHPYGCRGTGRATGRACMRRAVGNYHDLAEEARSLFIRLAPN
jgi:hypothetical protein